MGRRNLHGLELSWVKSNRQWRKRVDGKDYYFGTGKGVSDRAGYKKALAKYRTWLDEQQGGKFEVTPITTGKQIGLEDIINMLAAAVLRTGQPAEHKSAEQLADETNARMVAAGRPPISKPEHFLALPPAAVAIANARVQTMQGELATYEKVLGPAKPVVGQSDVDRVLDDYIADLRRRLEQTQKSPDTMRQKDRLGGSAFRAQNYSIELLRSHLRKTGLADLKDAAAVERGLISFRTAIDKSVASGDYKAGGIEARVKAVRPFFDWAWRMREIAEQPRCMDMVTAKGLRESTTKPLSPETITKLWTKADDWMRCCIALGLNCGYYAVDVAKMRPEFLKPPGYIACRRHKTGVPAKHKLWPLTQALIKRHRSDKLGLVFTRFAKGNDLPYMVERDNGKYDAIGTAFADLAREAGVKATLSQLRDTGAHYIEIIGKTGEGAIDKALVDQYLSHADGRMAKAYLDQDPAMIESSKLDAAIDQLADIFKLKDDPKLAGTAKASVPAKRLASASR